LIAGHDVFGGAFHDRDVFRAACYYKRALYALEAVQPSIVTRHDKDYALDYGGDEEKVGSRDDLSYSHVSMRRNNLTDLCHTSRYSNSLQDSISH
jgi:hypothetical protein